MSFHFPAGGNTLGATANFNMGSGNPHPFTWAFWVKIGTSTLPASPQEICRVGNAASDRYFSADVVNISVWSGGKGILQKYFDAVGQDGIGSAILSALDSNAWNHVALVFNGTASTTDSNLWRIYFNGVDSNLLEAGHDANNYATTLEAIYVGTYAHATVPSFYMAEIGMWKSALSGADIGLLYTNKYSPGLVSASTLRHYWSLWTSHANEGRDDRVGDADMQTKVGNPTTDGEHPSGMIYALGATTKYDIPTSVADGTVRKLFVYTNLTFTEILVNGATVTSSGGHFKYNDPAATPGTARPALMTGFGASSSVAASGGPCWATGISE